MAASAVCSPAEASGFLVGPAVFKTDVGARAPRRVRFPSASAKGTDESLSGYAARVNVTWVTPLGEEATSTR
jgi:hypothetical protein